VVCLSRRGHARPRELLSKRRNSPQAAAGWAAIAAIALFSTLVAIIAFFAA
jgi:hypothetical protein